MPIGISSAKSRRHGVKDRPSAYIDALTTLAKARVDFMVVGVGGVNFFAADAATAFATQDLDLWMRPTATNLRRALTALARGGFRFEAGGEPFVDIDDVVVLGNVIRMAANLVARRDEGSRIDLMLEMREFDFEEVFGASPRFRVAGASIRVAPLETILASKRAAGREKDLRFLEAFFARRDDFVPEANKRVGRPKRGRRPK